MPTNLIVLIAALIVAFIVFKALLNVAKTAISTVLSLFLIVVILSVFGFTPQDLMQEIMNLPQIIERSITEIRKLFGF
ncbi:MAG: hypothetical protein KME64_01770 [Scytonematopsis contorta HA4267-MV1]|jgi:uncharacterized protein YacL|nr:hypothetical protein [Scytonematopsis contorta HA4267-MV1]